VEAFTPQIPQRITLHHEGVLLTGSISEPNYLANTVQNWSINERGWPDIPYHFIIGLNGTIYEGRPIMARGDSNTTYDLDGHVHIAVLGKYDAGEQEPAEIQIDAIVRLMAWIAATYDIAPHTINGHRDFIPVNAYGDHIDSGTGEIITCPGDNLYRYLKEGIIQNRVRAIIDESG
jgi:hypothetical protein